MLFSHSAIIGIVGAPDGVGVGVGVMVGVGVSEGVGVLVGVLVGVVVGVLVGVLVGVGFLLRKRIDGRDVPEARRGVARTVCGESDFLFFRREYR